MVTSATSAVDIDDAWPFFTRFGKNDKLVREAFEIIKSEGFEVERFAIRAGMPYDFVFLTPLGLRIAVECAGARLTNEEAVGRSIRDALHSSKIPAAELLFIDRIFPDRFREAIKLYRSVEAVELKGLRRFLHRYKGIEKPKLKRKPSPSKGPNVASKIKANIDSIIVAAEALGACACNRFRGRCWNDGFGTEAVGRFKSLRLRA